MTYCYAKGYKSYTRAELALVAMLEEGEVMQCEVARISSYWDSNSRKRFAIWLK
jgi:hypothetical protein